MFFSYLCTYDNCDYKSWFCTIIPIQCLYICLYRLASWYNMMHIAYRAKLLDTETMITTRHIYRQYERHKDKIFIAQFKGLHRIQASQDKCKLLNKKLIWIFTAQNSKYIQYLQ